MGYTFFLCFLTNVFKFYQNDATLEQNTDSGYLNRKPYSTS